MPEPLTLPIGRFEHPALDFAALRAASIEHLERWASQQWTDYNVHDPGITILEQLCYAITDLAFRTAHDLPDLLAGGARDARQSLPSPGRVLTGEPVTALDLRKLVYDVDGVRNAWLEPLEDSVPAVYHHAGAQEIRLQPEGRETQRLKLRGLHRVLVEKLDQVDAASLRRAVARRLHAHRPLCEDFDIQVLDAQPVQVIARVQIGSVDDPERLLLEIYRRIGDYLSPPVPFLTLAEVLALGRGVDEIFDGPRLEHGFLDSARLAANVRRTALYTSDLIHEIMNVPGVRAVRNISVALPGSAPRSWSLDILPSHVPRLSLDAVDIRLERAGLSVAVDGERVRAAYAASGQAAPRPVAGGAPDLPLPRGRNRDVGRYRSIRHEFPAAYGVGELGLPESLPPERKARARQLGAYLLFFDQCLANAFAQLEHVGQLFSFDADPVRTYFAGSIDEPDPERERLLARPGVAHRQWLDEKVETTRESHLPIDPGTSPERTNRFLNHLLARFGESFNDYSLMLFDALPPGASAATKVARDKQAFLQRLSRVSGARGTGRDDFNASDSSERSGLEERLALKLGLVEADGERLFVIEHILLRPVGEDLAQVGAGPGRPVPLLTGVEWSDPYSLQVSVVLPERLLERRATAPDARDNFRRFIEQTIREETPAHLTAHVRFFDEAAFGRFESAYREAMAQYRQYWAEQLGL